jgi:hypothetical protein
VRVDGLPPATVNIGKWEAANAFEAMLQKSMRNGEPPQARGTGRAEAEAGADRHTSDSRTAAGATESWDDRVAPPTMPHSGRTCWPRNADCQLPSDCFRTGSDGSTTPAGDGRIHKSMCILNL